MTSYEMIADGLLPLKLCAAIVLAYLIHEWVTDKWGGDDWPDGFV